MNNTYRKFFMVLRAWWITLMLFAFIPMVNAQTITSVVADADDYPGAEVVVTMNVLGFTAHATYNYYVVYNYEDYDKILSFTHNQTTDIVKTLDGAGDGTIVITADVPVELYTYGMSDLTVLVVSANGALVYQLDAPVVPGSNYPGPGTHNLGDYSFADYNNEARIFDSSVQFDPASPFYEFDANTDFSFTLHRINSEPAIKSAVLVQYKKGTGAWTTIRTLSLNNAGGAGLFQAFNSGDADWPAGIVGKDISLRVIQTDGELLSSGIDVWAVENFQVNDVIGEAPVVSDLSPVFNSAFYVKNVIAYNDVTSLDDFTVIAPSFSIASITPPAAGFYPGEVVTYNVLSGANVSFPAATLFEVYLTEVGGAGREVLLGSFPLSGATGLPAATANKDFTFNTPFLPGEWELNVRADLRDGAVVATSPASFVILGVNLTATIDYAATAAAQKFDLDGGTYLFPGSTVHVDYNLGVGETINTTNLNVQVALDYNDGDGWVELKSQAFSMTPASQTINAILPSTITSDFIDLRLRLVYGTQVDLLTAFVERDWDDNGYGGNVNELPYYQFAPTVLPSGSKIGFHIFAVNNTAQSMVVEYTDVDQPIWTSLGTLSTLLTDSKFVSHFGSATSNISAVPTGLLSVDNPMYRIRWADGGPLGTNIALYKGVRFQVPNELSVQSNWPVLGILYPHITLSDNIAAEVFEFADTLANVSIVVDYSKWKIPATAQVAVVLLEEGGNPMVDPYLYLGSKAAGATDGEDNQTFTVSYEAIEAVFGDLPQLPDAAMEFDIWVLLTTKAAADPIMFKTQEIVVGWKDGYDAQPMMITEAIDLTGLDAPVYLSYDWNVTTAPDPLNDLTRPVMEYTIDEGITWTKIDQHDFTTMFQIDTIDDLMASTMARFRWTQTIELGDWDVDNVKILSGEDNLVTYVYGMTGIPQVIEMVLAEEEVPPVVDPCEDFDNASIISYEFTTDVESVNAGEEFAFDWTFLGVNAAKAIVDQELTTDDQYLLGANTMEFELDFSSDKKITQFVMTFPTGVVPSAATIIEDGGNTLTPTVSTSARTVTYASAAGVILGGPVYFDVTFAVGATISDTIDVAFTITDVDGTKNGICEIAPALAFPEGTVFTFWVNDGVEDIEIAEVTELGEANALIPADLITGAYDIFVTAEYFYDDEAKAMVSCGVIGPFTVYEDLFVINQETPEVYQILINEVNFQDPSDDYYWGEDVEVKFETFGPWQDFEDLNYEVVLAQYDYVPSGAIVDVFNETFEGAFPPVGWSNTVLSGNPWVTTATAYTGVNGAYHNDNAGAQDSWFITPAIDIPASGGSQLNFWTRYRWLAWYGNSSILVSTGSSDPLDGDFVQVWTKPGAHSAESTWYNTIVSLGAYAGQTIYIAFRYEGDFSHEWFIDDVKVQNSPMDKFIIDQINLGNIPHEEGVNQYEGIFTLPMFEDLDGTDFTMDITGTTFEVEVRAFQGEGSYYDAVEIMSIDEFYALSGTEDETTPLTFDLEDYRFAITNELQIAGYVGQVVNLEFTYTADITAPNFLSLPRLQVTLDYGLTYTDIEVPGSAFEDQARLDANVINKIYRYPVPDEYLTNNTRFRWYQQVPDGEWTIDDISISRETNEVPVNNYMINDPAYFITVVEEVIPDFCDQFDVSSFAGYMWGVDEVDPVTGFEAPVKTEEDFTYTWAFDELSGVDTFPSETEYLFYIEKVASTFKSKAANFDFRAQFGDGKPERVYQTIDSDIASLNTSKEDENGVWIGWDDGIPVGAVGAGASTYHEASRWLPADISDYDGLPITMIRFPMGDVVTSGAVKIWQGPDPSNLTQMLRQPFIQVEDTWIEVVLDEPYIIDATQELWFGIEWVGQASKFPMIRDAVNDYYAFGNLVKLGTDPWAALSDYGLAGDWVINAFVEGAIGPILINKDGLPITMADAPFIGFIPENVVTGIYEVYAVANISDGTKVTCQFGPELVKDDLLVINENDTAEVYHNLVVDSLVIDSLSVNRAVVGQNFNAMYSTYGPWPEDINFAAVYGDHIFDVFNETGQNVTTDTLQMPYLPIEFEEATVSYGLPNSPGQYDWSDDTYAELGWTEFDVEEKGLVTSINVSYTWDADAWASEGYFFIESPVGNWALIAQGLGDGTYSIDVDDLAGESLEGTWKVYIMDAWGDGGHQATGVNVTFTYTQPFFYIYAYFGDELILSDVEMELDMDEFTMYGYDEGDEEFNMEGNRHATTPVMDLSELDPNNAKLIFDFEDVNLTQAAVVLPMLQVSINGGTTFTNVISLTEDKQYKVAIGSFLGPQVSFRWMQRANFGEDFDVWTIDNVVITSGEDNIYFRSNPTLFEQVIPQVDIDYAFEILKDASDLEPAIYPGAEFEYSWDVVANGDSYPEGTIFTIALYKNGEIVIDNLTNEPVILQESDETGTLTAVAPFVDRDTYDVYVIATYDGFIYDEDYVGVINIFNPVIRTSLVGLEVPYAGGTASFVGTLETNPSITLSTAYWYNLIIEDGGDDWLLAAQQGSAAFNNVELFKFMFGTLNFKIQASIGGPLGVVGQIIDFSNDEVIVMNHTMAEEGNPGQRSILTLEMEDYNVNLADYAAIEFNVFFSEEIANLADAQHIILEYSINGGKNFTEIHTYPDARFSDETYFDGDWFMERELLIPDAAKVEGAILRFRIQQTKGDVMLNDLRLVASTDVRNAPYFALISEIAVAQQRIEILGTDAISYCNDDIISFTYNIRGSFGEFAEIYLSANGNWTNLMLNGITDGTGVVDFNVQELNDMGISGDVSFYFYVYDPTFGDDLGFYNEVWGDESEFVEVVAKIDEGTDVEAMNNYSCDVAERFVVVDNPQDYFVYQARNAVTLENLSEAIVYDPEDLSLLNLSGDFVLPIGVVEERIIVEVVVIAQTKDGSLVCETLVLDDQIVFDLRNLALQYIWDNNEIGGVWMNMPETPGDFVICYNSTDLEFRLWDYSADNGNGAVVNADIKWYRDNTETPVGSSGWLNNFPLTGEYFAVVTSEFCDQFTTTPVEVTVELAPEKPIIEFIGEQEFCEGGHASLQIADTYAHYRWYRNGSMIEGSDMNMIDIYQSGYYEVQVSNYAFDPFVPVCSTWADGLSVVLNIHEKPLIPWFQLVDDDLCEPMPAQIRVDSYENDVWYQPYIWETGEATGTAKLGYEDGDPIVLETDVLEQGVKLGIMAWRMGVEMCDPVYSTEVYEVKVYNLTIEVSGNVLIASLAPYDNQVSSYQWYRNDVVVQNGGTSRTLTIYDEATYSVKVMTYDGCILMASVAKDNEEPGDDVVLSSMTANLYPNPVVDQLTLKLDGDYLGNIQVRIINLAGVVIYDLNAEKAAVEFEQDISVDNLTQGVYIIQITGGEYSEVKRFIKK